MLKITLLYLVLFSFNLPVSFAGNEVGNGGVGFWCPETKKYMLLDFYEYELLNSEHRIFSTNETDAEKILNERLAILLKLDEKNFKQYSRQAKEIFSKINFIEGISLNKSNDSFEVAKPKGCKLNQFALQRKKTDNSTTEFFFDKEIWGQLDPVTKAGLVLHEIIYEQFAFFGEKNSIKVRQLSALIMSKKIESMGALEYRAFIKELRLPLY